MKESRAATRKVLNIYLAGVGGQGLVLMNRLLARAAFLAGLDAKSTDTAGLAMRGGSVMGTLRIGKNVGISIFRPGMGDLLIGQEPLEALHGVPLLRRGARAVVSVDELWPTEVCLEEKPYPNNWRDIMEGVGIRVKSVPGRRLALRAGDYRMVNVVMVGAASEYLPIPDEAFREAIRATAPEGTFDRAVRAFELGKKSCPAMVVPEKMH